MIRNASYFNVNDIVLYGKYKNGHAKIVGFGKDKHGNPTVILEPIPKGKKQNKEMGLFKIWHAEETKRTACRVAARHSIQLGVPPVRQTPGLCGPAALQAILAFYGIGKSEAELAELSGANRREGVGIAGLISAAKALGFHAKAKAKATLEELEDIVNQGIPVIVDWFSTDEGHYSVVTGIDKENIYLQDPELAKIRSKPRKEFERVWFDFDGSKPSKENLCSHTFLVVIP